MRLPFIKSILWVISRTSSSGSSKRFGIKFNKTSYSRTIYLAAPPSIFKQTPETYFASGEAKYKYP